MCQPKPGLRCSNHAQKALTQAANEYNKAVLLSNDDAAAEKAGIVLQQALMDFDMTKAGQKQLRDKLQVARQSGDAPMAATYQARITESLRRKDRRKNLAEAFKQAKERYKKSSYSDESTANIAASEISVIDKQYDSTADKTKALQQRISMHEEQAKKSRSAKNQTVSALEERANMTASISESDVMVAAAHDLNVERHTKIANTLKAEKDKLSKPTVNRAASATPPPARTPAQHTQYRSVDTDETGAITEVFPFTYTDDEGKQNLESTLTVARQYGAKNRKIQTREVTDYEPLSDNMASIAAVPEGVSKARQYRLVDIDDNGDRQPVTGLTYVGDEGLEHIKSTLEIAKSYGAKNRSIEAREKSDWF